MNPFLWSFPAFLAFYLLYGVALLVLQRRWIKRDGQAASVDLQQLASDPFRIAYLRGGAAETVKIATISLVDRGLLINKRSNVQIRDLDALKLAQHPIEKDVLQHYLKMDSIFHMPTKSMRAICDVYRDELTRQGLVITSQQKNKRRMQAAAVITCFLTVMLFKLAIDAERGNHNAELVVNFAIVFIIMAIVRARQQRTAAGDAALRDLNKQFGRLKARSHMLRPAVHNENVTLAAAIFGTEYLPDEYFPFIERLYPRVKGD